MAKTQTHTAPEIQTATVRVNSWQNLRRVQILPDQVGLQVTVPRCSHCVTCQSRVRQFESTLGRKPDALHQWKYLDDGAQWLFLPRRNEQNPLETLRQTLEIRIERY